MSVIFTDSDLHSFVIFELVFDVSHNFVIMSCSPSWPEHTGKQMCKKKFLVQKNK